MSYASMVHDGTKAHAIRPRTKKALRFKMGGRWVIAAAVWHPGTRARPFLDQAVREIAGGKGYDIRDS